MDSKTQITTSWLHFLKGLAISCSPYWNEHHRPFAGMESQRLAGFTMSRVLKYRLLRHLPGKLGDRYKKKFRVLSSIAEFHIAVRQSVNKTCIDLGANVGEYVRVMADCGCKVIAFEPDPWAFQQLCANLSGYTNIKFENYAAGIHNGTVTLWRHGNFDDDPATYSISSSIMPEKFSSDTSGDSLDVYAIDFIEYLEHLDECIGVIKMDIEGAELDILEKLLGRPDVLSRISYIFVETHGLQIPTHRPRIELLKQRVAQLQTPRINLDWH